METDEPCQTSWCLSDAKPRRRNFEHFYSDYRRDEQSRTSRASWRCRKYSGRHNESRRATFCMLEETATKRRLTYDWKIEDYEITADYRLCKTRVEETLLYMNFPYEHWSRLRTTITVSSALWEKFVAAPPPPRGRLPEESIPAIGGVTIGRDRNGNMIMTVVFDFKHDFHKRINGVELLFPEIISGFKFQFINPVVGVPGWKKIADPAVTIRHPLGNADPWGFISSLSKEDDRDSRRRRPTVDIQNVCAQLIRFSWFRRRAGVATARKQLPTIQKARKNGFSMVVLLYFTAAGLSTASLSCVSLLPALLLRNSETVKVSDNLFKVSKNLIFSFRNLAPAHPGYQAIYQHLRKIQPEWRFFIEKSKKQWSWPSVRRMGMTAFRQLSILKFCFAIRPPRSAPVTRSVRQLFSTQVKLACRW